MLEPAAKLGGIEPKEDGDLIWIATEDGIVWAAFTVRMVNRVLEIRCAGGARMRDWLEPLETAMTAFGRECGMARLELRGRKGWSRWKDRFGWKLDRIEDSPVFAKEL